MLVCHGCGKKVSPTSDLDNKIYHLTVLEAALYTGYPNTCLHLHTKFSLWECLFQNFLLLGLDGLVYKASCYASPVT